MERRRVILHVGCGGEALPSWLACFDEVRLDIDPRHKPDIVASMTDLGEIGSFDALFCSHALEHLQEVDKALAEFYRVLMPGGYAIIFVPDLEDVKPTEDVLYVSEAGPITGLDLIYGHRKQVVGNPHMAHRTGFVRHTLERALEAVGFKAVVKRLPHFNLFAVGIK